MFCDFQTKTYGKWILAGEHAVVRGHEALVFPVKDKHLLLNYFSQKPLGVEYAGIRSEDMYLFWQILEKGLFKVGFTLEHLTGQFHIENTIPIGVGMGASAALCVAVSRWFCAQALINHDQCNEFAKDLEHVFHGTSSGLDIVGVASETGVCFKEGLSIALKSNMQPNWYLSSCEQKGVTSQCIETVRRLWSSDPHRAQAIDLQMSEAVTLCKSALEHHDAHSLSRLADAMNSAKSCFIQWGLVSEDLQNHMNQLLSKGALAVKPTGSGGGGYVVSLWENSPSNFDFEMISV